MITPTDEWKEGFIARLAAMPATDPLLIGLRGLIERNVWDTLEGSCRPGMDAHDRAYNDGRQGALLDLAQQLDDAWKQAHQPPADR